MGSKKKGNAEAAEAARIQQQQMDRLDAIDLPDIQKMRLLLEAPELLDAAPMLLGESNLENISLDPELRRQQFERLADIQDLAETGRSAEDRDVAEELSQGAGNREQARQASLLQQLALRGATDSRTADIIRREAAQRSANRGALERDLMIQQDAANRRAAIEQQAALSGQMRQQEMAEQSNLAATRDQRSQANLLERQRAQQQVQQYADQAAEMRNQQQTYNKQLAQQQYENEIAKATGQQQAANTLTQNMMQQAQAQQAARARALQGLAQAGTSLVGVGVKSGMFDSSPSAPQQSAPMAINYTGSGNTGRTA